MNENEVKELYDIIDKCHIRINNIFGITRSDSEEDLVEVRDYINDPKYKDNEKINSFNKRKVQYYFESHGLYFRLFYIGDSIKIDFTGNEFLDEIQFYYKTKELGIINTSKIALELLIEKIKRYHEFNKYNMREGSPEYEIIKRSVLIESIEE